MVLYVGLPLTGVHNHPVSAPDAVTLSGGATCSVLGGCVASLIGSSGLTPRLGGVGCHGVLVSVFAALVVFFLRRIISTAALIALNIDGLPEFDESMIADSIAELLVPPPELVLLALDAADGGDGFAVSCVRRRENGYQPVCGINRYYLY